MQINAGFTFRAFEWQAVLAARVLAGRATLPPQPERDEWERKRIALKGDGVPFTMLVPDFEQYFEQVRALAGEEGPGRKLPPFDKGWLEKFHAGHASRRDMWRRNNQALAKGRLISQGAKL